MPVYHLLGEVPRRGHAGGPREERMGRAEGATSRLYRTRKPGSVLSIRALQAVERVVEAPTLWRARHFRTHRAGAEERMALLSNRDVTISAWTPGTIDIFYRNGQADEILYCAFGSGVLETLLGELAFHRGDCVVIPRGIAYRVRPNPVPQRFLVMESAGAAGVPAEYRTPEGQLRDSAPYGERDVRRPAMLPVHDERGEFPLLVKQEGWWQQIVLDHHPFDVSGWEGFYYPWALHLPDFTRPGAVVAGAGFRVLYDGAGAEQETRTDRDVAVYTPQLEAAPRAGLEFGSLTVHPAGWPRETGAEPAVVIESARTLEVHAGMSSIEDAEYARNWLP